MVTIAFNKKLTLFCYFNKKTTKKQMLKNLSLYAGNFLEFYDFTLFAYLIPIISPILFPNTDLVTSYTTGYLFLAIGFFFRPIGAVFFGHIGDKYGRKVALQASILMMAFSTCIMGLLPSEGVHQYTLSIIIIVCRALQGLSAGGEYSGAGLMLIEGIEKEKQFSLGAYLTASALLGAFFAALLAASAIWFVETPNYWRILFLIGGIIGFVVYFLRFFLTQDSDNCSEEKKVEYISWYNLIKKHYLSIIFVIVCSGLMNVPFQMVTGFVNTYFIASGEYTKQTLMVVNAFIVLFCALITILFGKITNIFDPKKMMIGASVCMTLYAFPFFWLVKQDNIYVFVTAELLLIILSQMFVAPSFATLANLFPKKIRYRGLAVGNCIGIAFLGGITPYLSSIMVQGTQIEWAPALYLFSIAMSGSLVAILLSQDKKILAGELYAK